MTTDITIEIGGDGLFCHSCEYMWSSDINTVKCDVFGERLKGGGWFSGNSVYRCQSCLDAEKDIK